MKSPATYLDEQALLSRVPTLGPGPWTGAESLSAEDNALLEHVASNAPLGEIASAVGLDPGVVIGSILRLHALGILALAEGEPFFDEGEVLAAVPRFDPLVTNREAALDEPDRLLLAVMDGRTDLGTLSRFVPLPRDRVVSSILRLSRERVIDLGPARRPAISRRPHGAEPSAPDEPGGHPPDPRSDLTASGEIDVARRSAGAAPARPGAEPLRAEPPVEPVRVTVLDRPSRATSHEPVRSAPAGPPLDADRPAPPRPQPPSPRRPPPGHDPAWARSRPETHPLEEARERSGSSPRVGAGLPPIQIAEPPPIVQREPTLEAKAARLLQQIKRLSDTEIEKQVAAQEERPSEPARDRRSPTGRHPRIEASAGETRGAPRTPRTGTGSFRRVPETSARPAAVGKAKPRSFSLVFKFDAAEVAKIALLGLVLTGGYHLVRAIYGGGGAPASGQPRPIAIERLMVHLPVVEAYPSGDRFQARVSAEWDAMDRATRKGKLLKMLLPVLQAGYTSVYLYDQSGALVATWAGGDLTLNDGDGSPDSG